MKIVMEIAMNYAWALLALVALTQAASALAYLLGRWRRRREERVEWTSRESAGLERRDEVGSRR